MEQQDTGEQSASQNTPKKGLIKDRKFSNMHLAVFAVVFAVVGFFIIKSFAAGTVILTQQAEQLSLPTGAVAYNDSGASGGQAVQMSGNGILSGTINLPSAATSLTLIAKGATCSGSPVASIRVDGNTVLPNTSVGSGGWSSYSGSVSLAAGNHSVSVTGSNIGKVQKGKKKSCARVLYLDAINYYGDTTPPPAVPTVTLTANPTTVTAGQGTTLSWNSTSATSCTASGAWSGSQAISGSLTTGALSTNSTFTLTCTGSGGTTSASATVTVSQVAPTPTPPDVYLNPSAQSYALGSTFSVQIRENSGTNTVNTVQSNLTYPASLLTLVSVDYTGSAFPTAAQSIYGNGSITLANAVSCSTTCPSKTGDQLVANLNFKVNSTAGTANLAFTTGTQLLSSSTNQNILPSLSSAYGGSYTLK